MADIFHEVDEEVRKERAAEYWKKYGNYVIAACVVVVLATAGRVAWRHYAETTMQEEARRYVAATRLAANNDLSSAITSLDSLAADTSSGYAVIARLQAAAARARNGDRDGAVREYDSLAADTDAEAVYRQLASLSAAMLLLDDGDIADLEARLAPLTADGAPWRPLARELQAAVALRKGAQDEARTIFKALVDEAGTPEGVRLRAREMLAALGEGS